MTPSISIITTCKGRLHHLRQTLPSMIEQGAHEVIVVDYDCPDGAGDWVEAKFQGVKVVRVKDPQGFCASRARNLGADQAQGEWLAFVDADNIVRHGWLNWLQERLGKKRFFVAGQEGGEPDSMGAIICLRSDFRSVGRYDEAIRGWGGEDTDLRLRLRSIGLNQVGFPSALMRPIPHGDEQRAVTGDMSKREYGFRNKLYVRAKMALAVRCIRLELCCRRSLPESASDTVRVLGAERKKDCYPFSFNLYCPDCAAWLSYNVSLRLHRQPNRLFRKKTHRLTISDFN